MTAPTAVGLPERDAFLDHEFVRFGRGMNVVVDADAVRPEAQLRNRGGHDVERLVADVERAEQRRLDQLQVALVAGRQLGGDAEHFGQAGLRRGSAAAHQFEDVRDCASAA